MSATITKTKSQLFEEIEKLEEKIKLHDGNNLKALHFIRSHRARLWHMIHNGDYVTEEGEGENK